MYCRVKNCSMQDSWKQSMEVSQNERALNSIRDGWWLTVSYSTKLNLFKFQHFDPKPFSFTIQLRCVHPPICFDPGILWRLVTTTNFQLYCLRALKHRKHQKITKTIILPAWES